MFCRYLYFIYKNQYPFLFKRNFRSADSPPQGSKKNRLDNLAHFKWNFAEGILNERALFAQWIALEKWSVRRTLVDSTFGAPMNGRAWNSHWFVLPNELPLSRLSLRRTRSLTRSVRWLVFPPSNIIVFKSYFFVEEIEAHVSRVSLIISHWVLEMQARHCKLS